MQENCTAKTLLVSHCRKRSMLWMQPRSIFAWRFCNGQSSEPIRVRLKCILYLTYEVISRRLSPLRMGRFMMLTSLISSLLNPVRFTLWTRLICRFSTVVCYSPGTGFFCNSRKFEPLISATILSFC